MWVAATLAVITVDVTNVDLAGDVVSPAEHQCAGDTEGLFFRPKEEDDAVIGPRGKSVYCPIVRLADSSDVSANVQLCAQAEPRCERRTGVYGGLQNVGQLSVEVAFPEVQSVVGDSVAQGVSPFLQR